jgi:hypothetical protein
VFWLINTFYDFVKTVDTDLEKRYAIISFFSSSISVFACHIIPLVIHHYTVNASVSWHTIKNNICPDAWFKYVLFLISQQRFVTLTNGTQLYSIHMAPIQWPRQGPCRAGSPRANRPLKFAVIHLDWFSVLRQKTVLWISVVRSGSYVVNIYRKRRFHESREAPKRLFTPLHQR